MLFLLSAREDFKMLTKAKCRFSDAVQVHLFSIIKVILGSIVLALSARVQIPLSPVPMTLQTPAVFMLALLFGGRQACMAVLFYLLQGTFGLPVFSMGICPLWFFGPTGGYLCAMPVAAYLIGVLAEKRPISLLWTMFAILCGQCVIYLFGFFFLARLIGFEKALTHGVLPFLPSAGLKLLIVSSMRKSYCVVKGYLQSRR